MHRPMHIINSKKKKGIKPVCESREINIKYHCFLGDRLIFFFRDILTSTRVRGISLKPIIIMYTPNYLEVIYSTMFRFFFIL